MLNLQALEKALSVIGNVGKGEITFEVEGVPVTLRALLPEEDIAVQQYAREGNEGDDETSAFTFLERFKRATLSFAIVQIGPVDLREVRYVETGAFLENGTPVRVEKTTAVRKIMEGWTRLTTMILMEKYKELLTRLDADAERSIQFTPSDLDAEIARIENRLEALKREKARKAEPRDVSAQVVQSILAADQAVTHRNERVLDVAANRPGQRTPDPVLEPEPEPEPTPARPATPPAAPPAGRQRLMPPTPAAPHRPAPPAPAPTREHTPPPSPFDDVMDSMSDATEESMALETERLLAARAAARQASLDAVRRDETDIIPASPARRTPPHRVAANTADAVFDTSPGALESASHLGTVGDLDAYSLPAETLSKRGQSHRPQGGNTRIALNEEPALQPNNPRFRRPGGLK